MVMVLMDFLGDSSPASALDVAFFVREIIETNPKLREGILQRLMDSFSQIRSSRVTSCALWILGEYVDTTSDALAAIEVIKQALGPLPLATKDMAPGDATEAEGKAASDAGSVVAPALVAPISQRPVILPDGSYATQSAVSEQAFTQKVVAAGLGTPSIPNLRALLLSGDFFLGGVVALTLAKLAVRVGKIGQLDRPAFHRLAAECMLCMASILALGESPSMQHRIDGDSAERIGLGIEVLARGADPALFDSLVTEGRRAFAETLREKVETRAREAREAGREKAAQPDELISFGHLKAKSGMSQLEKEDTISSDLARATGVGRSELAAGASSKFLPLTGLSDPLFVEALVTVHQYDILLDVTVINRTRDTLQNVTLELATMGDLKLVDRLQSYNMAPGAVKQQRINIKVSSTETGVIFGNIVYETSGSYSDRQVVILSDIHIGEASVPTPVVGRSAACQCTHRRSRALPPRSPQTPTPPAARVQMSWTTSALPPARTPSSGRCGPSSNGRTRSRFQPTSPTSTTSSTTSSPPPT